MIHFVQVLEDWDLGTLVLSLTSAGHESGFPSNSDLKRPQVWSASLLKLNTDASGSTLNSLELKM